MKNSDSVKIRMDEIFRYPFPGAPVHDGKYKNFYDLTKGNHRTGIGIGGKGIFAYSSIPERGTDIKRTPAILLHSNPNKEGSEWTPWIDILNPDSGYIIYNGDNKSSKTSAGESPGNKKMLEVFRLYSDPNLRKYAPPILIFRQETIGGKPKGYRSFQGLCVISKVRIQTQKSGGSRECFTNFVFDLIVLDLSREENTFNWEWINKRRDEAITSEEALKIAPWAWQKWVEEGDACFDSIQRKVIKGKIYTKKEQTPTNRSLLSILDEVYHYYDKKKYHFEGLAARIINRILGDAYKPLWITVRSGDGGVDFVGRLSLGIDAEIAQTQITVLGQAKCIHPSNTLGGKDLARVAARLQRGWIGAFVTTGTFTMNAQIEQMQDRYPILLITGKVLAQELLKLMNERNCPLPAILDESSRWYEENIRSLLPSQVADYQS